MNANVASEQALSEQELEMNKIRKYTTTKELWGKVIAIDEGSLEAKLAQRDLLQTKLNSLTMLKGE